MKEHPINLVKVEETVKIPAFSSIKVVDGHLVGVLEDYIETPVELLKEGVKVERFN